MESRSSTETASRASRRRLVFWALFVVLASITIAAMIAMPGRTHSGPLPPLTPRQAQIRDGLRRHVESLAGEIGERNLTRPAALEKAATYLEAALQRPDDKVSSEPFLAGGRPARNVVGERQGAARKDEIVVVGAHYDSVFGSPGANDNASGVAALLELARLLEGNTHARTLRLVGFANEEPPYFTTEAMGSLHHARRSRERGEKIVAMLSLETLGCYFDAPGSQSYPFPLALFYPSTGNFVAFVGNTGSRSLVRRTIAAFRRHAAFPSEGAALPGFIPGVGWSDHWSFWQAGYPAVMVTDTALFRYPAYHSLDDTPEKVDYERAARVVDGLASVVLELLGEA